LYQCLHTLNFSFKNYAFPTEWKNGYITPIHKDLKNDCIDNLRPITQTDVHSKVSEGFMYDRLHIQIIDKLNPHQYNHSKLIHALSDLGVNHHDIYRVAEFLRQRTQCTRDKNIVSNLLSISNGTPQGTKLACLLFIVLVDKILKSFYEKFHNETNTMKAFVDDMCVAEVVKYGCLPI